MILDKGAHRACAVLFLGLAWTLLGCPRKADPATGAADAAPMASAHAKDGGDEVESVYPIDDRGPPDPLAAKLCAGLGEMPEKKRAACCTTTPGVVLTPECTRAKVDLRELSSRDVDRKAVVPLGIEHPIHP